MLSPLSLNAVKLLKKTFPRSEARECLFAHSKAREHSFERSKAREYLYPGCKNRNQLFSDSKEEISNKVDNVRYDSIYHRFQKM